MTFITCQDNPNVFRPRRRRSMTLAELMLSLSAMSVLLMGIASAMVLAARAMDVEDDSVQAVDAGWALSQMAEELACAVVVTERTATAITFSVPDRNDDDALETIRYEWLGAGTGLTRDYNGSGPVSVASDLQLFELDYTSRTETVEGPPSEVVSAEGILAAHYPMAAIQGSQDIRDTDWVAQTLEPVLPADTISWSITGVQIIARSDGAVTGDTFVQIREAANTGEPTNTVLGQTALPESALFSMPSWKRVDIAGVEGLPPAAKVCLVLQHRTGGVSMSAQSERRPGDVDGLLWATWNAGASWSRYQEYDLCHALYGTVTAPGAPTSENHELLTAVRIALRTSGSDDSLLETAVVVYNEPQLPD